MGPRPSFHLSRNVLQSGDEIVAVYSAGLWRSQTNSFLVLCIGEDVSLTYADETKKSVVHGPFDKLFIVDGTIHAGERDGTIVSRFDEATGHWLCFADRLPWRNISFANADY